MTTYMKISDLIKENYPKELINHLIADILEVTKKAQIDYPDYQNWFLNKQVPGVYKNTRDIIVAMKNGKIIGVANLKKDDEKKICTLYIKPKFQKRKEGILLVEKSIDFLETSKPIITMPITKVKSFYPIIERFGWILSDEIDDCYKENTKELIFNSTLEPISITDSIPTVLEKIYQKKRNPNIFKFGFHITPLKGFILKLFSYKKSI